MTDQEQKKLGQTLWNIADQLRGAMNADDFRDYMLAFLFLRYLSDNYEAAAAKELGPDYPALGADDRRAPLSAWYAANTDDAATFETQMRRKVHYVIRPEHLWTSIVEMARVQNGELLDTLQKGHEVHRGGVIPKHVQGAVFGDQPVVGKARQDAAGPQCGAVQDHHRERQGPETILDEQRYAG